MGDTEKVDKLFALVQQMDKSTKGNSEYNIFANDDKIAEHIKGYNDIKYNTAYLDILNDYYNKYPNLYTKAFLNYVNQMDAQLNHAKNDILKFVNIGKIFKKFHCGKNDFRYRLRSHIVNVHTVRIWNKKILMLKLQNLLREIIIEIGDCNDSFFGRNILQQPVQQIKNIASQAPSNMIPEPAKRFLKSIKKMATHKEGIQASSDSPEPIIPKEVSKEISIVNNVRSQTSLLLRMYEAKIVSDKEYKYVEKIDSVHWVTNPAIIASLTAVISNAAFYTGVTDKLLESGVANSLISSASPLLALFVASIGTAITKTDAYQELELNKKILLEFSKLKKDFIKQFKIVQHECPDTNNKESKFKEVMTKIEEFKKDCNKYYNEILDMCTDYAGVYDVICTEPIEPVIDNKENDEQASDTDIDKMVDKIRKCDATGLNDIKKLTDDELRDKLRRLTKSQINKIKCTETGKNIVNTLKMPSPSPSPSQSKTAGSKTRTISKTKKNKTRSRSR